MTSLIGLASSIPFVLCMQIRMALIQHLETTHLEPVAAPSCDVMTLLHPAATGAQPSSESKSDPTSSVNPAAADEKEWEAMSCVVSERNSDVLM